MGAKTKKVVDKKKILKYIGEIFLGIFLVASIVGIVVFTESGINDFRNTSWHQVNTVDHTAYHIAAIDTDSISVHQYNAETGLYLLVWYGSYKPNREDCFSSWNQDNAVVFLYKEKYGQLVFNDIVFTVDAKYGN